MSAPITCIVAMGRGGAIGRANTLPWRLADDLRRFKALTLGHAVIMGRKTWESIGRPLPGRTSIVLTRDPGWGAAGALRAGDLESALVAARAAHPYAPPMVIGGAQVYALALPRAEVLHVTEIDLDVADADAFFPGFDRADWDVRHEEARTTPEGVRYRFVDLMRRR